MSKDLPPSRTAEQFVVRFPDGMRDRIAEAAKANGRSMNAEIVHRLQESFGESSQKPKSTYATEYGDDPPPPNIYAELAIHAERRALAIESDKLGLLQDELWAVNTWRETYYGQNCTHHLSEIAAGLAETIGELSELDKEIEVARKDADAAAQRAPGLPGPWNRR